MRIKRILILSSAILCMLTAIQGRTIRDFFASEPGRIFTLLPSNTRLDLLDYFDSGKIVWAQNNLGNGTSLSAVDSTSITVVTSESKTVQLRLLTQGSKDSVIAVIETVHTPVPDSRITFYNTRWERLPDGKKFKKPSLSDFFLSRVSKSQRQSLLETLPFTLVELEFIDGGRLVARQHLKEFLSKEDFAQFRPHVVDSLVFVVNGTRIKPLKH